MFFFIRRNNISTILFGTWHLCLKPSDSTAELHILVSRLE